jgi:hypothetical protein
MKSYRFVVQRRVTIVGYSHAGKFVTSPISRRDKPFLLAEEWHTVAGLIRREDADTVLDQVRTSKPHHEFRLVDSKLNRVINDWRNAPGRVVVGETGKMKLA